jgi:hypothetical protein
MNYVVTDLAMRRKVERWLHENNDCYSFDDVMQYIEEGKFQTHLFGQTWVLTSIHEFPRRKTVHLDLVVGNMDEFFEQLPTIMEWARSVGATLITGSGRPGWRGLHPTHFEGWRFKGYHYSKEL